MHPSNSRPGPTLLQLEPYEVRYVLSHEYIMVAIYDFFYCTLYLLGKGHHYVYIHCVGPTPLCALLHKHISVVSIVPPMNTTTEPISYWETVISLHTSSSADIFMRCELICTDHCDRR